MIFSNINPKIRFCLPAIVTGICLFIFTPVKALPAPDLVINNYNSVVDFSERKIALIKKGDDPVYNQR